MRALITRKSCAVEMCNTVTAEIHARSLVNFYDQYADRHMNLKFMRRVNELEREIRQFVIVKKQIDVTF